MISTFEVALFSRKYRLVLFQRSRRAHARAGLFATLLLSAAVTPSCKGDDSSDDLDAGVGGFGGTGGLSGNGGLSGTAGRAGSDTGGGGRGTSGGGTGPGQADAGPGGSSGTDAGGFDIPDGSVVSPDPNIFRPEEIPPTAALLQQLDVPAGFELHTFATGLGKARMLATWGDYVYLTRPEAGDVVRFDAPQGSDAATGQVTVVSGLPLVHGIVFDGDRVFLATGEAVLRGDVDDDGNFGMLSAIIDDLPSGGQHPLRTLGIGPDDSLYISVGSTCDACAETDPENATILRATLDGDQRTVYASGLRNTIGFDWHPSTNELWGMDQGSDYRGDDLPPEELNRISDGSHYGWPYCFGERRADAIIDDPPGTTKSAYCSATTGTVLETQAHNSPIAFAFYEGTSFPNEYRSDAFLALHGSWNRVPPGGYKIARVEFNGSGEPVRFTDFVTGFLVNGGTEAFGRPAGLAVAQDGSLLFTDDSNGIIYRVRYVGSEPPDAGVGEDPGDAGAD